MLLNSLCLDVDNSSILDKVLSKEKNFHRLLSLEEIRDDFEVVIGTFTKTNFRFFLSFDCSIPRLFIII